MNIRYKLHKNTILKYFLISALIFSPSLFFHSRQIFLFYPVEIFFYMFILNFLEDFNRIIYFLLNLIILSVTLFFTVYGILTGSEIGPQILASVFETNPKEAVEFSSSLFFQKFVAIYLLLIAVSIYLLSIKKDSKKIYKDRRVLLASIPFIFIFSAHTYKDYNSYPQIIIQEGIKYFDTVSEGNQKYKSLKYSFEGEVNNTKQSNFILIIGETARKASYSLYGYERDTNPLLSNSRDNLILFNQAISASSLTRTSVPSLLSTLAIKSWDNIYSYPSLIKIINSQNYHTNVISNQTIHSVNDIFINTILRESKNMVFLEEENNNYFNKLFYDKDLLPYLQKTIMNKEKTNFTILHLSGSHFRYDLKYPQEYNYFKTGSNIDKYDNSIRYTDSLLYEVKQMIKKQKEPYVVLYVSDHGECLNDFGSGLYGHGMTKDVTIFELEIPFILFYNDAFAKTHRDDIKFLKQNVDKKISHDNVSHTILDILGIYPKTYEQSYALSSENFKENERFIHHTTGKIVKFKDVKFRE